METKPDVRRMRNSTITKTRRKSGRDKSYAFDKKGTSLERFHFAQRTRQSPHASNRMKPLLKLPFEHRVLRMVLESNNKSNEVDLACVFLFPKYKRGPHLSKRGVGQSKLQKLNGKKSALFSQGRQTSAPGNACY